MYLRTHTAQKMKFASKISSVNVIKSAVSDGFGDIYWRNPECKTSFFVLCQIKELRCKAKFKRHEDKIVKNCCKVHKFSNKEPKNMKTKLQKMVAKCANLISSF